jgi:antitoxin component YwqK of YwqJK toxin-antitoxin module
MKDAVIKFKDYLNIKFKMKFNNYDSNELKILENIILNYNGDKYLANYIESFIYSYKEENYINGNKKIKYRLKYDLKDGKYVEWWNNGNILMEIDYKDDMIHGFKKIYYPNGKLWSISKYNLNELIELNNE